jgi:hypothetical protein
MLVGDPFTVHQKFVSRYQLGAADAKWNRMIQKYVKFHHWQDPVSLLRNGRMQYQKSSKRACQVYFALKSLTKSQPCPKTTPNPTQNVHDTPLQTRTLRISEDQTSRNSLSPSLHTILWYQCAPSRHIAIALHDVIRVIFAWKFCAAKCGCAEGLNPCREE